MSYISVSSFSHSSHGKEQYEINCNICNTFYNPLWHVGVLLSYFAIIPTTKVFTHAAKWWSTMPWKVDISHGLWRHCGLVIHLSSQMMVILMYHNFNPKIDNGNNGLSCISKIVSKAFFIWKKCKMGNNWELWKNLI